MMAYRYEVAPDAKFDHAMNTGTPYDAELITMPNLSSLLRGFDDTPAPSRTLGEYAYPKGNEFSQSLEGFKYDWGAPLKAAPAVRAPDVAAPAYSEPRREAAAPVQNDSANEVQIGGLTAALNCLSRADRYAQSVVQPAQSRRYDV